MTASTHLCSTSPIPLLSLKAEAAVILAQVSDLKDELQFVQRFQAIESLKAQSEATAIFKGIG
jgi:hypothetical protein